jgi:1,2-diacylglycerol 3-beta-galactosyltransferase
MILRPNFYSMASVNKAEERGRLGLSPDVPTGVMLFGGAGSAVMLNIAKRLGNSPERLQLIAICGRNAELKQQLDSLKPRNPLFVEGFTQQIPYYMQLSDFLIGKPGPGTIAEAVHMNLPVIVERNAWTLPQERYNADWVREHNVGLVLKSFREIEQAVQELLGSGKLAAMRESAGQIENRAVFEITDILGRLLGERGR